MQPRTKGFIDSVSAMKGKIPAVYNLEAIFDNANSAKPTLSNILLRKPFTIYFYLKRIPYKDLPSTEKEQEQFLRKMFEEKVKIILNAVKNDIDLKTIKQSNRLLNGCFVLL